MGVSRKTAKKAQSNAAVVESRYQVLLVDDHPIVRQGLAQLINQQPDLQVCAQAEDAHQALEKIGVSRPDLAIVDLSLKSMSGLELMKDIKIQYPNLPVLVLSMHDESLYAERALRAGAKGYIMKQEAPEKLLEAIRQVQKGNIFLSDRMGARMLQQMVSGRNDPSAPSLEMLSDRELEVFQLIGQGVGTRQIAERLHLSVKTIESYREHIKRKMRLNSGTELVQHAVHWIKSEGLT